MAAIEEGTKINKAIPTGNAFIKDTFTYTG